jgi:hypothetical protein
MPRAKVLRIFAMRGTLFYFVVSRGKPKQAIEHLWFSHQDEVIGRFDVREIVCNVGQLPKLRSLENRESEWQIKLDRWVAICPGPFQPTKNLWMPGDEPIFYGSFRGFRYFSLETWLDNPMSRVDLNASLEEGGSTGTTSF